MGYFKEKGKNILWVRTDAIGDNVLASSMLPFLKSFYLDGRIIVVCQIHLAELYEHCPFVDAVIPFDRLRAYKEEKYRVEILDQIRTFNIDIAPSVISDAVKDMLFDRDPNAKIFAQKKDNWMTQGSRPRWQSCENLIGEDIEVIYCDTDRGCNGVHQISAMDLEESNFQGEALFNDDELAKSRNRFIHTH